MVRPGWALSGLHLNEKEPGDHTPTGPSFCPAPISPLHSCLKSVDNLFFLVVHGRQGRPAGVSERKFPVEISFPPHLLVVHDAWATPQMLRERCRPRRREAGAGAARRRAVAQQLLGQVDVRGVGREDAGHHQRRCRLPPLWAGCKQWEQRRVDDEEKSGN